MTAVRARHGGIDENRVPVRGPSPVFTEGDGGARGGNCDNARERSLEGPQNSMCLKGIKRKFAPHKKEMPERGHLDGVLRKGGVPFT